ALRQVDAMRFQSRPKAGVPFAAEDVRMSSRSSNMSAIERSPRCQPAARNSRCSQAGYGQQRFQQFLQLRGLELTQLRMRDATPLVDDDGERQRGKLVTKRLGQLDGTEPADQHRIIDPDLFDVVAHFVDLIDGDADKL